MVRDILLDIEERDLALEDKSLETEPVFDTVWGSLFSTDPQDVLMCNIIIPEAYRSVVTFSDGTMTCRFTSEYVPQDNAFNIRPVLLSGGVYGHFSDEIAGTEGYEARSFFRGNNIATAVHASMLPFIDADGGFRVKFGRTESTKNLNKAYIYSSRQTDLAIGYSDDQASQLLTLCAPGKSYRYPTTGVGVYGYLNSVVEHTDLYEVLEEQFSNDSRPIQSAVFDNTTGKLDVLYTPAEPVEDEGLDDVADLNQGFFGLFSDEYVRKNSVISESATEDFIADLLSYDEFKEIILTIDDTVETGRVPASILGSGTISAAGEVVLDETAGTVVLAVDVDADTIIMFDGEAEQLFNTSAVLKVESYDGEVREAYTYLVGQPYWISAEARKCFIVKKRSRLYYSIYMASYRQGAGLRVVPQTSANIKNLCGVVQDELDGTLYCLVSDNTNITDATIDEITQHILATHT